MNRLVGHITGVKSSEHLTLVSISVGPHLLSSVVIDTPQTVDYLKPGNKITVVFKETEVIVGTGDGANISLRNRLPGTITSIEEGPLLSKVILDTDVGEITAIITSNATKALGLTRGKKAMAMIKTNEIMLSQ